MTPIIQAQKLSRWYGLILGLNKISFDVYPGITGLVGPNGAGKSTLIQLINGRIKPSSGSITVFDQQPWNNPNVLQKIGYCPEKDSLHDFMKPIPWLVALGRLSGIPADSTQHLAEEALRRVQLDPIHWSKSLKEYSKGMRQRVKLAQALIHRPQLVILDEPMNGLDPMARSMVSHILKDLARQGTSVLISSHILHELETLCSKLILLNWGRIIGTGTPEEISRQTSKVLIEKILIRCTHPRQLLNVLFQMDAINGFQIEAGTDLLELTVKDPDQFYPNIVSWIKQAGVSVHEIRHQSKSLQSVFQQLTS